MRYFTRGALLLVITFFVWGCDDGYRATDAHRRIIVDDLNPPQPPGPRIPQPSDSVFSRPESPTAGNKDRVTLQGAFSQTELGCYILEVSDGKLFELQFVKPPTPPRLPKGTPVKVTGYYSLQLGSRCWVGAIIIVDSIAPLINSVRPSIAGQIR
jgi:hypothetical protein